MLVFIPFQPFFKDPPPKRGIPLTSKPDPIWSGRVLEPPSMEMVVTLDLKAVTTGIFPTTWVRVKRLVFSNKFLLVSPCLTLSHLVSPCLTLSPLVPTCFNSSHRNQSSLLSSPFQPCLSIFSLSEPLQFIPFRWGFQILRIRISQFRSNYTSVTKSSLRWTLWRKSLECIIFAHALFEKSSRHLLMVQENSIQKQEFPHL